MIVEVRGEKSAGASFGKLLFKWDSQSNEISIVQRDMLYRVLLMPDGYKILSVSKK